MDSQLAGKLYYLYVDDDTYASTVSLRTLITILLNSRAKIPLADILLGDIEPAVVTWATKSPTDYPDGLLRAFSSFCVTFVKYIENGLLLNEA